MNARGHRTSAYKRLAPSEWAGLALAALLLLAPAALVPVVVNATGDGDNVDGTRAATRTPRGRASSARCGQPSRG